MTSEKICKNCAYFAINICKRFPPINGLDEIHRLDEKTFKAFYVIAHAPTTELDQCGEWKEAEKLPLDIRTNARSDV